MACDKIGRAIERVRGPSTMQWALQLNANITPFLTDRIGRRDLTLKAYEISRDIPAI